MLFKLNSEQQKRAIGLIEYVKTKDELDQIKSKIDIIKINDSEEILNKIENFLDKKIQRRNSAF